METPLYVVFNIVTGFAMLLFFIRFMLELAEINPKDPYAEPMFITSSVVDVFANIFKPLAGGRFCTSAVVLMFLVRSIDIAGNLFLMNLGYTPAQLVYVATTSLLLDFLNMASWVIIGSAIASLVILVSEKIHPLVDILMQLSNPISAPFRKISPNLGMIDISPMIALLAIILMEIIIETLARYMLPMLVTEREQLLFTARILGLIN